MARSNRGKPRIGRIGYLEPRGLSRCEAAAYIGISPSSFDRMLDNHDMPPPKQINGRKVWCRLELDEAFERLPGGSALSEENPWDSGDAA